MIKTEYCLILLESPLAFANEFDATGRRFHSITIDCSKNRLYESIDKRVSSTQPQHCVVTIDVWILRLVPWNRFSDDLGTVPVTAKQPKKQPTSTKRSTIHTVRSIIIDTLYPQRTLSRSTRLFIRKMFNVTKQKVDMWTGIRRPAMNNTA